MADFSFKIVESFGVIEEGSKGWNTELNKVAWGEAAPKWDIRAWSPDHTKCGKGITLTDEGIRNLKTALGVAVMD